MDCVWYFLYESSWIRCGGATWHRDGCKLEEHLLGGRLKLQFVLLGLLHVLLLGLLRPRSVVVG